MGTGGLHATRCLWLGEPPTSHLSQAQINNSRFQAAGGRIWLLCLGDDHCLLAAGAEKGAEASTEEVPMVTNDGTRRVAIER